VGASRLLAIANGLSSPLALDLAMRLTAVGRPTEFVADPIGQQIAARQLSPADTCIVISGSGANESSLRSARAVRAAGARLVVVTSFARSPLVTLADAALVVAPASGSFRHELEHTSRIPHVVLLESLVEVVASRLGDVARQSRSTVLSILSDNLSD
jgi:DNA-binding MurR/RpiR family transcriptional regulator